MFSTRGNRFIQWKILCVLADINDLLTKERNRVKEEKKENKRKQEETRAIAVRQPATNKNREEPTEKEKGQTNNDNDTYLLPC